MEKEENQKSGSIDKSQKEEIPENNINGIIGTLTKINLCQSLE